MELDDVAMISLRMSAATKLVGRVCINFELTEDERAAMERAQFGCSTVRDHHAEI